jgi:DNA (cytosine-5)-methyltransferase 1
MRKAEMLRTKLQWHEFFAGGGMARLGMGDSWQCTFANDWCPKKASAYASYFQPCPELKIQDVKALSARELPGTPDLVWASFPCQDLSLAGSGAGLEGARSGTFAPFWRLIRGLIEEDRKPRVVVLENVVGTITAHGGRDFRTLLGAISKCGYRVGPLVMDAVHFVPQSRPRLFVVAFDDNEHLPLELVRPAAGTVWHSHSLTKAFKESSSRLKESWVWWSLPKPEAGIVPALSSLIEPDPIGVDWHSKAQTDRLISLMSDLNLEKLASAQKERIRKIGTVYKRTRPILPGIGQRRVQRAEIRFDEISGCLRTPVGGSSRQIVVVVEGRQVRSRLLSPREAARLMGVPEDYPIPSNYNDAYHLFGDGVVVPVVKWLEKHLIRPLALHKRLERVA